MKDDLNGRRMAAMLVLAVILLASMVMPGPRARVEITTAQASVLLETGPLRIRAFVSTALPWPAMPTLSIGGVAR